MQKNKSFKTAAETSNSVKDILINQLQKDPDELNIELDKVHILPLSFSKSKAQQKNSTKYNLLLQKP